MLIRNYGLFWKRRDIWWGSPGTRRADPERLLVQSLKSNADRSGFRVSGKRSARSMSENFRLVYLGQAGGADKYRLLDRLRNHRQDQLADRWSLFSWFGIIPVTTVKLTGRGKGKDLEDCRRSQSHRGDLARGGRSHRITVKVGASADDQLSNTDQHRDPGLESHDTSRRNDPSSSGATADSGVIAPLTAKAMKDVYTTKIDPTYDDLPEQRYHFPRTYLRQAEAAVGDWIVYYEPRRPGAAGTGGRQAYFAAARVLRVRADPSRADHFYADVADYLEFDRPVPFRDGSHYFESGLQRDDGGTSKGAFGRAVRACPRRRVRRHSRRWLRPSAQLGSRPADAWRSGFGGLRRRTGDLRPPSR